jgi:hypothetical protein
MTRNLPTLVACVAFVVAPSVAPPARADALQGANAPLPGSYRCASYNLSGGGGSCRNMQRLVLNADGTYRHSSTRGRWRVKNGRLVLSESKLWGPGELVGRDTIRFTYHYRGWRHVVTWVCQECAGQVAGPAAGSAPSGASPAAVGGDGGAAASRGASAAGAQVGVSLTLEFDQNIGGVSGFVIVPAEHAPAFTHEAPLPPGAVQGLAWETSATAVGLGTNKANKLASGKRYVVFLSWPRETLPVAILDLPPTTVDYTARLRATLDGNAVLRQLGRASSAP